MSASLFDSNVWVGLTFTAHPANQKSLEALAECSSDHPAIFCRSTEQSFLRLTSTPSVLKKYHNTGLTNSHVIRILDSLHDLGNVAYFDEPPATRELWLKLANRETASPKLWMDAYLAAFAISGKFRFVTFDKDFRQFENAGLDLHLLTA